MDRDCSSDILRLGEPIRDVGLFVAQPSNVEAVVTGRDLLAAETAETPFLAMILALGLSVRIVSETLLEFCKIHPRQGNCLAEGWHVGAQIIDPHSLCVVLFSSATCEEQHVRFNSRRVENAGRQPKNRVQ